MCLLFNMPSRLVITFLPRSNIFISLINMCLEVFCLRFILFKTLWISWPWVAISFPILRKFSTIIQRRQWHPTQALLPGKSHGQRSLVGCCLWGRTESDMTEWLHFTSTIISSSIFSWPFFLSSSSGTPMIQTLGCLTLSQRSLRLSSFLLILFSFFLYASFISTILSSTSLILSSACYSVVDSL